MFLVADAGYVREATAVRCRSSPCAAIAGMRARATCNPASSISLARDEVRRRFAGVPLFASFSMYPVAAGNGVLIVNESTLSMMLDLCL